MVFSGLTFIYLFLPAVFMLYFCVPAKLKNAVLLLASLVFYFCGEQLYLALMLAEILATYVAGRLVEKTEGKKKKAVLVIFLIFSFLMLGVFKYADLLPETINKLAGREILTLLKLPLPIGISFYIFQSVSYGIDVYRGKYPAEKNFARLALYVSFFPQLIAGPIVRFDVVRDKLISRAHSLEGFSEGIFRFCIGLGKKVLLADRLFAFCEAASGAPSVLLSWVEGFAYFLYVYFDFSGYSDMAIGLAKCFGFDLPENFDYPLLSKSFKEFWRRWHISLGTWFRDYLYFPLGGSRVAVWKHIRNLLVVWALTGLWHGAYWNYVLWGLTSGLVLCVEMLVEKRWKSSETIRTVGEKKAKKTAETGDTAAIVRILKRILVIIVTILGFTWFRFTDFGDTLTMFSRMFGNASFISNDSSYVLRGGLLLLIIATIGATPHPKHIAKQLVNSDIGKRLQPLMKTVVLLFILAVSTAYLVDGSFSPFLYFRF